jgi:ATP-dependent HslUV protease subunit HslV
MLKTDLTGQAKLDIFQRSRHRIKIKPMKFHGTTILAVRHKGKVAVAGDGQVTLNNTVIKHHAKKVRRIYNDRIIVGFAGATADALNLSERLEKKLERYNGNLTRSAVELARDWRTDKYLRRLEAIMIAVDDKNMFVISGSGDVIEPDEGLMGIGSGGMGAHAAAKAMIRNTDMDAVDIVKEAMKIVASLCVFTNDTITIEEF